MIGPEVALAGTVAYSVVVVLLDATTAGTPLKVTEFVDGVAPNPDPLIVTALPTAPEAGEKFVIDGTTENFVELVAMELPLKTKIFPVSVETGTTAVICVAEIYLDCATILQIIIPPVQEKETPELAVNPVPLIVTVVPIGPLVGENDVMEDETISTACAGVQRIAASKSNPEPSMRSHNRWPHNKRDASAWKKACESTYKPRRGSWGMARFPKK